MREAALVPGRRGHHDHLTSPGAPGAAGPSGYRARSAPHTSRWCSRVPPRVPRRFRPPACRADPALAAGRAYGQLERARVVIAGKSSNSQATYGIAWGCRCRSRRGWWHGVAGRAARRRWPACSASRTPPRPPTSAPRRSSERRDRSVVRGRCRRVATWATNSGTASTRFRRGPACRSGRRSRSPQPRVHETGGHAISHSRTSTPSAMPGSLRTRLPRRAAVRAPR